MHRHDCIAVVRPGKPQEAWFYPWAVAAIVRLDEDVSSWIYENTEGVEYLKLKIEAHPGQAEDITYVWKLVGIDDKHRGGRIRGVWPD